MILTTGELKKLITQPGASGFIVFEGINGAGKSTLIDRCSRYLTQHNRSYICTREPGGTALGKELRALLLERSDIPRSEYAEMLLFAADRSQHLSEVILPALEKKSLVLCDRYLYSTTAFQGFGRGIDLSFIDQCHALATQGKVPDFVILIDLDPEQALSRLKKRQSSEIDAFEAEQLAFHAKVREGFLYQAENSQVPFLVLDGEQAPEQLALEVQSLLSQYC